MKKVFKILLVMVFFIFPFSAQAGDLVERLSGRILLQVESNGEAWYVNPESKKRHFLGRPSDAFSVMREQGVGITNIDLRKIPVSVVLGSKNDSDRDGLSNEMELAIGTNPEKSDSDGDGFGDYDELRDGFNVNGEGELKFDSSFAKKHAGKIFLQVESKGEAWYVDPVSEKRFFLGRPTDAFSVMRSLGLGISNKDLNGIISFGPGYESSVLVKEIHRLINDERVKYGASLLAYNDELAKVAWEHSNNLAEENKAFTGLGYSCDYAIIHHEGFDFGLYNADRLKSRGLHYYSQTGENIALNPEVVFTVSYQVGSKYEEDIAACRYKQESWNKVFKVDVSGAEEDEQKIKIIEDEIAKRTVSFTNEYEVNVVDSNWFTAKELAGKIVDGWMNSPGHKANIINPDYDEAGIGVVEINGYAISTQVFIKRAKCGYERGECCEEKGYLPYCYIPLECSQEKICK